MQRLYQIWGLVVLAASAWVVVESRSNLDYYTELGPGPGFFPFWLGLILGFLSLVWLVQVSRGPVEPMAPDFIPERKSIVQIVIVILALMLVAALAELIGFTLALFVFLIVVMMVLGRTNPVLAVLSAAIVSWGLIYAFREFLSVPLPFASIEFLRNLGL